MRWNSHIRKCRWSQNQIPRGDTQSRLNGLIFFARISPTIFSDDRRRRTWIPVVIIISDTARWKLNNKGMGFEIMHMIKRGRSVRISKRKRWTQDKLTSLSKMSKLFIISVKMNQDSHSYILVIILYILSTTSSAPNRSSRTSREETHLCQIYNTRSSKQ